MFDRSAPRIIRVPMTPRRSASLALLLLTCLVAPSCARRPAATAIRLPALFGDHMVMQRNADVRVWGWADPGGRVVVALDAVRAEATVGDDSTWQVILPSGEAREGLELAVFASDTLRFTDVAVGEVWVCSGQSNMEWTVANSHQAAEELERAAYPSIRLFDIPHTATTRRAIDVASAGWFPVTPESVRNFSAVGYFFGRALAESLDVPIGLIGSNWGGTPAEAWTSSEGLASIDAFRDQVAALASAESPEAFVSREQAAFDSSLAAWGAALQAVDPGFSNGEAVWAQPDHEDAAWSSMPVPGQWEASGLPGYDGTVWFRRTIELPTGLLDRDLLLYLGPINDADDAWMNGIHLGSRNRHDADRAYTVPRDITRRGANTLVVRVLDAGGGGGFVGSADRMRLESAEPSRAMPIALAGPWKYRPGVPGRFASAWARPPRIQDIPSALFNGMIAPLTRYAIRGVIWYQGEANAPRAYQYRKLFPALITDWRSRWGQEEMPFLFVQLAAYMAPQTDPNENNPWPELREAQAMALRLPATGMAVAIDIGEADDIHPRNKQDVGARLARQALVVAYGRDLVPSGPVFRRLDVEGALARITFDATGGSLGVDGDTLLGFVMAGADSQFVWADAVIDGETVVVSSPRVKRPVAVRYGWANNPRVTLLNAAGLPAAPFRTDDWPGVTQDAQ